MTRFDRVEVTSVTQYLFYFLRFFGRVRSWMFIRCVDMTLRYAKGVFVVVPSLLQGGKLANGVCWATLQMEIYIRGTSTVVFYCSIVFSLNDNSLFVDRGLPGPCSVMSMWMTHVGRAGP